MAHLYLNPFFLNYYKNNIPAIPTLRLLLLLLHLPFLHLPLLRQPPSPFTPLPSRKIPPNLSLISFRHGGSPRRIESESAHGAAEG